MRGCDRAGADKTLATVLPGDLVPYSTGVSGAGHEVNVVTTTAVRHSRLRVGAGSSVAHRYLKPIFSK
jgi:hypothetical protein